MQWGYFACLGFHARKGHGAMPLCHKEPARAFGYFLPNAGASHSSDLTSTWRSVSLFVFTVHCSGYNDTEGKIDYLCGGTLVTKR